MSQFINRGLRVSSYAADAPASSGVAGVASSSLVAEPEDVEMRDAQVQIHAIVSRPAFAIHQTAEEIAYSPEEAFKEGLAMVKELQANIEQLALGSTLRKDVWLREIARYISFIINNVKG